MSDATPAAEISQVDPNWEFNEATGQWVQKTPTAPPQPPAPPAQDAPQAPAPQPPAPSDGGTPPPPAPPAPQAIPAPPSAAPAATAEPKVMSGDWPCAGYTGPQPWQADNPPALTQNHLMISSGSAGPEVVELAALLAHLGFGSSITTGDNAHAIYDSGVSDAVRAFCTDYGVQEDPKVRAARTEDTVGPWIWEALTRAVHKKLAGQAG